MINEIRFAVYAIIKNIKNTIELRTSFLLTVVGMAINNTSFLMIWVFFAQSVGEINGWTATDVLGLNGFLAIAYGVIFSVFAGIRHMPQYVADGTFDRFLLSPKNVLMRVITSVFDASSLGDIVFGAICFGIYAWMTEISLVQSCMLMILAVNATIMFFAVAIMIYAVSFYFTDPFMITRSLFEFYFTPAMFHGGIFHGTMRAVFSFIIPSLTIGTLPTEALAQTSWGNVTVLLCLTIMWSIVAIIFFQRSLKKYESANFMTFGR